MNSDKIYSLRYKLTEPLVAKDARKPPTFKEKRALLHLVLDNLCPGPNCNKVLFDDWGNMEINNEEKIQVAHLYARKNFNKIKDDHNGVNGFHIYRLEQLDTYGNYIYLCNDCHYKYDTPPTYEKYTEMVEIKRNLVNRLSFKQQLQYSLIVLDEDFKTIVNILEESSTTFNKNLYKMELHNKLDYNKINIFRKNSITSDIENYYITLDRYFQDEGREVLVYIIDAYKKLSLQETSKDSILDILVNTISSLLQGIHREVIQAIVSYLIMKCEVLENDYTG